MPVNIPDTLPASEVLKNENVFVMHQSRAVTQDIRPLRIGILNLMPLKETTETHLIRMLSNTPIQVEIVLLYTKTHTPKHTSTEHLESFYQSFDDLENKKHKTETEIKELERDIRDLTIEIENSDSLKFVEKVARDDLGMVKPREIIYIDKNKIKNPFINIFKKDN